MARKLLVEGLDWGVTDESLRATFAPFGHVVDARVARDWETGRSRGFGSVTFDDDMAARLAIQTMDGARLDGKVVRVMFAPEHEQGGTYRGGDYGRADSSTQTASDYRGGDYSDGRAPAKDKKVYRSADFGYADGPTSASGFRSADFDGGRRRTPTQEVAPATPEAAPEAAPAKGPAPAEEPAGGGPKNPKRGGAHRDANEGYKPGGSNDGVGGGGKKTFG